MKRIRHRDGGGKRKRSMGIFTFLFFQVALEACPDHFHLTGLQAVSASAMDEMERTLSAMEE